MSVLFDYTHAFPKGKPTSADKKTIREGLRQVQQSLQMVHEIDELGFADLPDNAAMLKQVLATAETYRGKITDLVVLGIGGSALGFIALKEALLHPFHNHVAKSLKLPAVHVLDNIDPEHVGGVLELINPKKTLVNVITKSGSTAETVGQFLIFFEAFAKKLGGKKQAVKQFLLTTDAAKGPLRKLVEKEGFASLPVPGNVGGRYSVLSPVGLFPAAVAGIDIRRLLQGAAGALATGLYVDDPIDSPSLVGAALHYLHYQQNRRIAVMMPYANSLYRVADWFRQLWAESLGKERSLQGKPVHIGPTPVASLGATDQHSQVQLYAEGPDDKFYTFLRLGKMRKNLRFPKSRWNEEAFTYFKGHTMFELLDAEAEATRFALTEAGRPCATVMLPKLDAETLGCLLMHLQVQTAAAGLMLDVNAFDQPGVEAGKRYAFGLMGRPGYEKEAAAIGKKVAKPFVIKG